MAFLTILRTSEERCEQCDSTEHVLNLVVSQDDEDTVRLTACVICVIVAMDNAMEWNMSRQFAQALANRQAGVQVHEIQQKERDALDERIKEAGERGRFALSDSAERRQSRPVRIDSEPLDRGSARPAQDSASGNRSSGGKRKQHPKT